MTCTSPASRMSRIRRIIRSRAWWIEPVGRLVEEEDLRAVRESLGELGELLHAQRVGADVAVARLAQADIEEDFVRPLEGLRRRHARQLGHQADEADAASCRR